ncbi:MAG: redoxin domain-containing protein [Melioribacteraceae bacterium]|nr:redoxin domain-containing protein [Melioribacteraceae bacterium]
MNNYKAAKIYFTLFFILSSFVLAGEKNFSFKPEKPTPATKITVTYNPQSTVLEKSSWIKVYVSEYSKSIDLTEEYDMVKKGGVWTGSFVTTDTATGLVIRFKGEEGFDDNVKKLYLVNLYDKSGKYLAGTFGGLATGYASWFQAFEIDPDPETAFKLFNKEFELNPSLKKDYISTYLYLVRNINKENPDEIITKEIEGIAAANSGSQDDLWLLLSLYRSHRMTDKAALIETEYKEKYPDGKHIPILKYEEYRQLKSLDEKIDFLKMVEASYPNHQYTNFMYEYILTLPVKENDIEKVVELLSSYKNASAMVYNSVAWSLFELGKDLNKAEELAEKGIQLAKKEIDMPKGKRPQFYSTSEWENSRKRSAGMVMDTYGAILLKQNKNIEAEKVLTEAVMLLGKEEPESNERYVSALMTNGKFDLAKKELEEFFSKAANTSGMKEMLKESYMKTGGTENGFDSYFRKFEDASKAKIIAKLQKEMINEPAPQFTLTDLNGKSVSLSDFKGKVVIVDFWATWCGPCLSSFPGMKQAVEKYESTGSAKFLFLNTWENVEDKKLNAADFIKKNNYPFHVLLDDKNEVVSSFKVRGIPTKFILDGTGNIRFKSVGFSGNTDEMVEEIGIMISMLE